jgi:4,5-dihydroxyphthalate decarboxylase
MDDPAITLTVADYPRLMPLASGAVRPVDVNLTLVLGKAGSWNSRASMLSRALLDPDVHGGEASMARHLLRIDRGDRSLVGLPAFPLRNLTARDIYVCKNSPVRTAPDLQGKRAGIYSWSASGAIWYRHLLRFLGIDPASLGWWVGAIDSPEWAVPDEDLPDAVHTAPPGRSLSDMLIAGELDVLFSPPRPARFHATSGPIVRLFPDFKPVEHDYVRVFGIWPPQHLIVLRREAWLANRHIARSLTDAFVRNNAVYEATLRSFPYITPWMESGLDEATALMGDHGHDDGLDRNRAAIDLFCNEAHRAGLTRRRISVDEYFQEYLET